MIYDSINLYNQINNKSLNSILNQKYKTNLKDYLIENHFEYINFLDKKRISQHNKGDCLIDDFKNRFEKFHMIKDNPFPIINGWMSLYMLKELDCGYNRLSFFLQKPVKYTFKDFSKNVIGKTNEEDINLKSFQPFIFEISQRALNLPLSTQNCGLNYDKCAVEDL